MSNSSIVVHSASSSKVKVATAAACDTSLNLKRGMFQKDLQHIMYGYVALVEDIVVEYITDLVHKAQDVATDRGKLLTDDFQHMIRKDMPKLHRCHELLSMNEELKQARKAFQVDEEKLASTD
ncbi:hypothetical protein MKW98_020023 [Papaver atlanticum]|uniref:Transcription initiation factor TFIID subunit 13 n=1 Tax=Papaver atlanticum TaxID=357466 RepID=A0AAD4S1K9_9MAGN|nr:hypothetical protein MKW98_020023 [Papaver atlanticum]